MILFIYVKNIFTLYTAIYTHIYTHIYMLIYIQNHIHVDLYIYREKVTGRTQNMVLKDTQSSQAPFTN